MSADFSALLAYIDPGTGAMVLQVLIAMVLGAGVMFRRVLGAPLAWFRKSGAETTAEVSERQDTDHEHRQAA